MTDPSSARGEPWGAAPAGARAPRALDPWWLLAALGHELRTLLNSILGFAQVLERGTVGPLTEHQRRLVDRVLDAGGGLLELVNDVLDAARLASGASGLPVPASRSLSLEGLLARTREALGPAGEAGDGPLDVELPPAIPEVVVDERLAVELLARLVDHTAAVAGGSGPVRVRVRVRDRDLAVDLAPGSAAGDPRAGSRPAEASLAVARLLARALGARLEVAPGAGARLAVGDDPAPPLVRLLLPLPDRTWEAPP